VEFTKSIREALSSYRLAATLYAKMRGKRFVALGLRAKGSISFVRYYLSQGVEEKRRLLESGVSLVGRALGALGPKDPAWPEACLAFLNYQSRALDFTWDPGKRRTILEKALAVGRESVEFLSSPAHRRELSSVHLLLSLFAGSGLYLVAKNTERETLRADSIAYAKSALALSKESGDAELQSRADLSTLSREGYTRRSADLFHSLLEDALESARRTKDNHLIADALSAKGYDLVWEMAAEEFPDERLRKFEECKTIANESLSRYRSLHDDEGISTTLGLVLAQAWYRLALAELDRSKRRKLLREAVSLGRRALVSFRRFGGVNDDTPSHTLAMALYQYSLLEGVTSQRRRILLEALKHVEETYRHRDSTTPFHKWNRGVTVFHEANIKAELSVSGSGPKKGELLRSAAEKMAVALSLCREHYGASDRIPQSILVGLGTYASRLYEILEELNRLAPDRELNEKIISALKQASAFYGEGGWPSRGAEAHWRLAQFLDGMGRHEESSSEFYSAAESFKTAAEKAKQFSGYYSDYSSYMRAWSTIEMGRLEATLGHHGNSAEHYRKAAEVLSVIARWKELGQYYSGWAETEEAEELSSKSRFREAIDLFRLSSNSFKSGLDALKERARNTESPEEKAHWQRFSDLALTRSKYCEGRKFLEEAKEHEGSGKNSESLEAYGRAVEAFESILPRGEQGEVGEVSTMIQLCRGWQAMKRAEQAPSLALYAEASKAFIAAAKEGVGGRLARVGLANAHFCEGMSSTIQFSETGSDAHYSRAKAEFEGAKSGYLEADLEKAADWTEAAMLLLDGRMFSLKAERSTDPSEKGRLYQSSEKSLELAATLFTRVGYPSKRREVERDLTRVKQRLALVSSIAEVSSVPLAATAATLDRPFLKEEARGLASFERANILARLGTEQEVEVGETTQVQLDLYNTGGKAAALLEVRDLFSRGLVPTSVPAPYELADRALRMKGRQIRPLQIESILVPVEAREVGEVVVSPKLVYLDDQGRLSLQALEGTTIKVIPPVTFEFETSQTNKIFESLVEAFVEDYMRRRLGAEQAGWRSFSQVVKEARVPPSALYSREGRRGAAIYELMARGLVETRVFERERGRGGAVSKARIAYDRDVIRRYVNRRIMKGNA